MRFVVLGIFIGLLVGCGTTPEQEELFRQRTIQTSIEKFEKELLNPDLTPEESVILREQVAIYRSQLSEDTMIQYLLDYVSANPTDPYNSFYLYRVARVSEERGLTNLGIQHYRRLVTSYPDVRWQNQSIHFLSLQRLVAIEGNPLLRVEYYQALLERFPNQIDQGYVYYHLAQDLEASGRYSESIRAFESFLRFPNTTITGVPDVHYQIREKLSFHYSNKSWLRPDLDTLISQVKSAISSRSGRNLLNLQAKVNFFTASWFQNRNDVNSRPDFNLMAFLYNDSRIHFAPQVELASDGTEAYLRTWGWSPRIPTWFLYFRQVDYPADPLIHGSWEWAGILLGESL